MRKKSHIDMVRYLKNNSEFERDINRHKLMLYFGSILPDLIPTFIYKRHRIDCTLQILENELQKLLKCTQIDGYYCRHIGIISHYVSDYYTLPHNLIYDGNMKQHCKYEGELKIRLREQIKESKMKYEDISSTKKITDKTIASLVVQKHNEYIQNLQSRVYNLDEDCHYIIYMNSLILELLEYVLAVKMHENCKQYNVGLV